MRRVVVPLIVLVVATGALMGLSGGGAGAAVRSAADLAADCNDDGVVDITTPVQYVGGSATITGVDHGFGAMCLVNLRADGAGLTLTNVRLVGSGDVTFNIGQSASFAGQSVVVRNSTLDFVPGPGIGGTLSVKAGCCAGEPFEAGASVTIQNSTLRGRGVEIGAGLAAPDGSVDVTNSTVVATGDPYLGVPDIELRAGVGANGVRGAIRVQRSTFVTPGGFLAHTGAAGSTAVTSSDLSGAAAGSSVVAITTGTGGTCTSTRNTPAVPCT